ncbi:Ig-like domain-containing protein [Octadecabacter arcticus]|uniref:Ig-like domain-containing protein n=1 Tax=Octadecabacter arcticus TaxID=53946 RepID=UPI001FDEDB66|nr:Ig-like domain-containing protein [Octadecabacter arcticus]
MSCDSPGVTVDTSGVGGGDNVVNNSEHPGGVALNGTAEAGASVVVTLGSMSHTVIAGENGIWSTTYLSSEVPTGEDTLSVTVVATDLAGNMSTADGSVVIDTFVNELEMTTNTAGGSDGIVNFDESSQSITMAGTVEVGSTVSVNLHGVVMQAAVDSSTGAWTVTYPGGTLLGGEYPATVTVTATDAAGNTSSLSEAVQVDTVAGDLALSTQPIELDDVVSFDEASDGVVINGTATPGLIVTVGLGASSMEVLAQPDGTWSANFSVSMLPADTDSAQIMASITDALGNYKEVRDSV